MDKITLKGMEFYARHGSMKEEQILGQKFTVDITMYLSLDKAGADDDLEKTVNYAKVYSFCRKIVERAPVRLIERLAWMINEKIMKEYPEILSIRTTVHKPGAPVGGIFQDVSVTLEKTR